MRLSIALLACLQLLVVTGCSGADDGISSVAPTQPAAVSSTTTRGSSEQDAKSGLSAQDDANSTTTTRSTAVLSAAEDVGRKEDSEDSPASERGSESESNQSAVPLTTVDPDSKETSGVAPAAQTPEGSAAGAATDGSSVWALVLAGASIPSDPLLTKAIADAETLGYEVGATNCDQGAAQALGMNPSTTYTVSLHFYTEESAQAALADLVAAGYAGELAEVVSECPA